MNLKINGRTVNEFLISLFVLISVIFPGDIYNLKKIVFFIICILNLKIIIIGLVNKKNVILSLFGFMFPTTLFLYSSFITGNIMQSFARTFAGYMFLIIFIVNFYKLDFEEILIKSIKIIMYATLLLTILDLIGIMDANNSLFRNKIMYGYGLGIMGKSPTYSFYYKIFFKTSPLIVILLFKRFNNSQYLNTFLAILALTISGTRANALFPLFFIFAFYVFHSGNKSKVIKFLFVSTTIVLTILFATQLIVILNDILITKGQVSNTVRQGHIEGIKELIRNDPWIILRGSGMGSEFYSYGVNAYTSNMEWSYIDLWRQMGFGFFSLFMIFISFPFLYKNKNRKYKKYAYLTYLCIAATNPLLFSSTSYLVFIYMYYDLKPRTKQQIFKGVLKWEP